MTVDGSSSGASELKKSDCLGLAAFVIAGRAAWILLYQVYSYLRQGTWPSRSVIGELEILSSGSVFSWFSNWIGVYEILDFIPSSIGYLFCAWMMCGIADSIAEAEKEKHEDT